MRKNWFWGVISIILVSWVVNFIYFQSKQLEKPVMLNAYLDIPTRDYTNLSLHYITNKKDIIELQSLSIGDQSFFNERNFIFPGFENPTAQSFKQEFTHHYLKEAMFSFGEEDIKNFQEEIKNNNEVYATFTNGQTVPVNVSKLDFTPYKTSDEAFIKGSGYNYTGNSRAEFLHINVPVNMEAFELPKAIQQDIDIKLMVWKDASEHSPIIREDASKEWENLNAPLYTEVKWPLQLNAGDSIGIFFHTKEDSKDVKTISLIQDWTGEDADGNQIKHVINIISNPILTQDQVTAIVKKARDDVK
ncbi:hypothetical protein WAX74_13945 [Psychrobacillus sp. FJAT-51614]|uniref:Regulatory protein YycH-like domain-containing protein n=1 Tax=Psychrobacillus mangrovi TaxID=3117745 RepID=A0ABU8F8Z0_9BACI